MATAMLFTAIAHKYLCAGVLIGAPPDREFWRRRLLTAGEHRQRVVSNTEAYRLVYSEGDLLPSVLIDRYGEHFVLQTLSRVRMR